MRRSLYRHLIQHTLWSRASFRTLPTYSIQYVSVFDIYRWRVPKYSQPWRKSRKRWCFFYFGWTSSVLSCRNCFQHLLIFFIFKFYFNSVTIYEFSFIVSKFKFYKSICISQNKIFKSLFVIYFQLNFWKFICIFQKFIYDTSHKQTFKNLFVILNLNFRKSICYIF